MAVQNLGSMFSKWIAGGMKSFGMTFGSQLAKGDGKGFVNPVTKPGVPGLAQAFLATGDKEGKASIYHDRLMRLQQSISNPTAASVMGGKTTPSIQVANVSPVGVNNPSIARAMRETAQRNVQIDPHFDRILRELYKEGSTQVSPNLQQGQLTQKA